jgi:hypothetical protein
VKRRQLASEPKWSKDVRVATCGFGRNLADGMCHMSNTAASSTRPRYIATSSVMSG